MTKSAEGEPSRKIEQAPLDDSLKKLFESDPSKLLPYLKDNVTPEKLLAERKAQAVVDAVMQDKRGGNRLKIVKKDPKGTSTSFIQPFQLIDPDHFYYFHVGRPIQDVPPSLKPENVIESLLVFSWRENQFPQSKMKKRLITWDGVPFNKPIHRVNVSGGPEQTYNFKTSSWEVPSILQWKKDDWDIPVHSQVIDTIF
jgi:hypothetical protein